MLLGLTGIFSFVLGGLILTRPEPLQASRVDAVTAAKVDAALGAEPLDRDCSSWTGLVVQHITRAPAEGVQADFRVVLDSPAGPSVLAGDAQMDRAGAPMVVTVTGNSANDADDWRSDPTVRLLVSRLCDRLKIDDRRVRWS